MWWFKCILGLTFFELVSILFAIVPDYSNGTRQKKIKSELVLKKIVPKIYNNYYNQPICFALFSRNQVKVLVSARPISSNSFTHLPWAGTIYLKCDGMQQVLVLCRLFKWEREYDFQFYVERTYTCAIEMIAKLILQDLLTQFIMLNCYYIRQKYSII